MDKKLARIKRAKRTRIQYREQDKTRLCVHRTPKHVYAQIISGDGAKVLVSASTLEQAIKDECKYTGNVESSKIVGKFIALRAVESGIKNVSFDRSGFKYHGRIKALADSAREHGLTL
jgi:large subunit ribosomal protein L18